MADMHHDNFFSIQADTHFDLGLRKGQLFGEYLRKKLAGMTRARWWSRFVRRSKDYLDVTRQYFPHLVEEYEGYARGASVPFDDLWTLDLLDELTDNGDHCTTFVTNNGFLVAHNEDWSPEAASGICLLQRTVGNRSAFELFYLNTLGGNSISINSGGIVHAVNSLEHRDRQIGVPKNVVARWMSDTHSPEEAYRSLSGVPRAGGYHHTLISAAGEVWSIECSASRQVMTRPSTPFVHTNHFLSNRLLDLEQARDDEGTYRRYRAASGGVSDAMSLESAQQLLSDSSQGRRLSIFNVRTIARVVIDVDHMVAHVWLARERAKGWLSYNVAF
jgi:predicted choloylglycine hydrolase